MQRAIQVLNSEFNYRIDGVFSKKKRFHRSFIYIVLISMWNGMTVGLLYWLGSMMGVDFDVPIRSSEFSGLQLGVFFSVFLLYIYTCIYIMILIAKRLFIWFRI